MTDYVYTTYPEAMVQDIIQCRIKGLMSSLYHDRNGEFVMKFDMKTAIKYVLKCIPPPIGGWAEEHIWDNMCDDETEFGALKINAYNYANEITGLKRLRMYANLFNLIEYSIEEDEDKEFTILYDIETDCLYSWDED